MALHEQSTIDLLSIYYLHRKKGRRERRLRGKLSLTLLKPSNYIEELKP